jgi:hypothetical protein
VTSKVRSSVIAAIMAVLTAIIGAAGYLTLGISAIVESTVGVYTGGALMGATIVVLSVLGIRGKAPAWLSKTVTFVTCIIIAVTAFIGVLISAAAESATGGKVLGGALAVSVIILIGFLLTWMKSFRTTD